MTNPQLNWLTFSHERLDSSVEYLNSYVTQYLPPDRAAGERVAGQKQAAGLAEDR